MRSTRFDLLSPEGRPASPAELFDAFTAARWPGVRRHFEQSFEVVALPGESAEGVQPGDLLVRRALGEGGLGFLEDAEGLGESYLPLDSLLLRSRDAEAEPANPAFPPTAVIHPRIDVHAQYSLQRLSRGDASERADAVGILGSVESGKLRGIYKEDQEVPARMAQRRGIGWWQVLAPGEDAALVLDPDLPFEAPPIIIFRDSIKENAARLDPALRAAWANFLLFESREIGECPALGETLATPAVQLRHIVPAGLCQLRKKGPAPGKKPPRPKPVMFQIEVRNRFLVNEPVPDCDVVLAGNGFRSVAKPTNRFGNTSLNLAGAPDGTYQLTFTPPANTAAAVGPAIGDPTTNPPDRIWRSFAVTVTIEKQRVKDVRISIVNGSLRVASGVIRAGLQPVWMRSKNQSARPKNKTIDLCVLHHTGSTTEGEALNTFMNQTTSAHYVVCRDGQAIKLVHESQTSNHAGNSHWAGVDGVNASSVGIEIVHLTGDYPTAQVAGVTRLVRMVLAAHTRILAARVVGHSDIGTFPDAPRRLGRKFGDPGPVFPWSTLRSAGIGLPLRRASMASTSYGGIFTMDPRLRLRDGDNDRNHRYGGRNRSGVTENVIRELQGDLTAIGYLCPVTGNYDVPTQQAVIVFQEHFLGVPAHPRQVDRDTARMIKRVRP